jgi:type I restriction enzyme S subunit
MNQLDLESAVYISDEMDRKIGRTRLHADDVLLNITGASIGRVATFDGQSKRANVNQHVCVIRPDPHVLNARYLSCFIATPEFQRSIQQAQVGGTRQALTFSQIADFEVPLPPVAEQGRIAEVLDRAEALRAKRRAALAQLDTLTQSIFLDLFGDPVVNLRGWPLKKFGDVGTLDRGVSKHRPRNAPELLGGSHPLVQTGEIANCNGYIRSYTSTYSDLGLRQSKMWPVGTLCITIAANIAKTGILTFQACFPDSVVGFLAEDPATVEFVRTWLSFLQKTLEDSAPESAQKNINLAILRDLDVPIPPLDLQRRFARRIGAVENLKTTHRDSLTELDSLFATLQHRAFRGEL